ncbi:flagellar export protein FliJ [Marinimicrobium sp. ABcell2]|uniref:flagellar export protein FliJ n=1 Tax=Marinimicrobium sp. ABcell2 TaxID=3069751 RepID=UPI0027B4239B|nr:flagellar export protein FliJ [Marinimicrobium sp. ABcell2]MDQ2078093.1 flagellar export protein FliJ [Marinimicrobium sp. ABcell2]
MARSERMRAVLILAERAEQEAAREFEACRERTLAEQQQLEQLQLYREQYVQEYQSRREGVHPSELISYSGFIQRLAAVLTEQEKKLQHVQQLLQQCQQQWQQMHRRKQSIQELIARLKKEENAALEQKLQRELDELSSQQHWHRRET